MERISLISTCGASVRTTVSTSGSSGIVHLPVCCFRPAAPLSRPSQELPGTLSPKSHIASAQSTCLSPTMYQFFFSAVMSFPISHTVCGKDLFLLSGRYAGNLLENACRPPFPPHEKGANFVFCRVQSGPHGRIWIEFDKRVTKAVLFILESLPSLPLRPKGMGKAASLSCASDFL